MRLSNFELLRIIAMLMVVNLHTFFMLEKLQLEDLSAWRICDFIRESSSISAVNLFVMISGYFSIKWKKKSLASLAFQVFFWVFGIYFLLLSLGVIEFNLKTFFLRLNFLGTSYWFISAYIGVYLLAPTMSLYIENQYNKSGGGTVIPYLFLSVGILFSNIR